MAGDKSRESDTEVEQTYFECHKTRKFECYICIICGKSFHKSCAIRDWKNKVKILDHSRLVCLHHDVTSNSKPEDSENLLLLKAETEYLRRLVSELEHKNAILIENCELWKDKAITLEKTKTKPKNNKTEVSELTSVNNDIQESSCDANINTVTSLENEPRQKKQAQLSSVAISSEQDTATVGKQDEDESHSEFQIPRHHRRLRQDFDQSKQKQRNEKQNIQQKRKIQIFGTKEWYPSDGFQTPNDEGKKIWIFVSKVKSDVTEEIIRNYIVRNGKTTADEISVKKCVPKVVKSQKGYFMVGVSPTLKETIYKPEFWPKGVAFQRFNFAMGRNFLNSK